ncbi:DUF4255 domain-containing protein [Catenuloplanes japonicus]|uniref:DUF4255 domain-containing protein n=1 Tax=Catenuloplanes japonicus TaxID=33876 RepID=UPI000689C4AC|nr:DUF4255 domain-containing protein [Catenuloplanes japonicus]
MSNHLAVAMTTAALRGLLSEAVAAGLPGGVESATVTTLRPDALATADGAARGINVYLFRVLPNGAAWAVELPARNSAGIPIARPAQAVDLQYLLTFSGDDAALEPQRLLGLATAALAVQPVLSRETIRATAAEAVRADAQSWQGHADLGDQLDVVRLSMLPLTVEELARLWSMVSSGPYRLSLAYQATAVLIEGDLAPAVCADVTEPVLTVSTVRR